jgi:exodeoxyribonuclease VII large subunit
MNKQQAIDESIIFSVSEVTLHLKQVIETQIEAVYIVGEISNFVHHSSGHIYCNLKDDNAVIRCAYFRNQNYQLQFKPRDGDQVICFGRITIFERSGQYQLIVQTMLPSGKGIMQQRFEQLKAKLKDEGLFAMEHKKPLPAFPECIGIVTSPTGAALQDILNILKRRYPCPVKLYPALMQGVESAGQVIKGIRHFNQFQTVDVIIIARGGGSQEDLFTFNDEALARAIYESDIPIISAIGHEIDFTIADFVADLRAPTPSAAAEIVAPDKADIQLKLSSIRRDIQLNLQNYLSKLHRAIQSNQLRLMRFNPELILQSYQQRFDIAAGVLLQTPDSISKQRQRYKALQSEFAHTTSLALQKIMHQKTQSVAYLALHFEHGMTSNVSNIRHKLELAATTLEELSPVRVLSRGYAFVRKSGNIVKSIKDLAEDDLLVVSLADGQAEAQVKSIHQEITSA